MGLGSSVMAQAQAGDWAVGGGAAWTEWVYPPLLPPLRLPLHRHLPLPLHLPLRLRLRLHRHLHRRLASS